MVDAGGDIACAGRPPGEPWVVSVADPLDEASDLAILDLDNGAIATSSRLGRQWQHRGMPAHHLMIRAPGAGIDRRCQRHCRGPPFAGRRDRCQDRADSGRGLGRSISVRACAGVSSARDGGWLPTYVRRL